MLKSVKWIENAMLVVQVDEGVYTLAQMRKNGLMEFFDTFKDSDNWTGLDLSECKILFCIFVAEKRLKKMFFRVLSEGEVLKNTRPIIKEMLSFEWVSEDTYTANLIELSEDFSSVGGRVVKANLSVKKDIDLIDRHEFCGVFGDPEKLLSRLKFFYEKGIDWDEQKKLIYPSLERPIGFPIN